METDYHSKLSTATSKETEAEDGKGKSGLIMNYVTKI